MKKLRFAIIGCGRIAQRHAEHISRKGILAAVCDIEKEKAYQLAKEYEAIAYDSYEELLKSSTDVDVISICTPNGLNAEHSIKGLKAGFHVLCEKPMELKTSDCKKMIEAAEAARSEEHTS